MNKLKIGELFVVATPIGNLGDISSRAIKVLSEVDLIAAEDTRHSRPLLEHFNIKTPMISLHEHNEKARIEKLLAKLQEGKNIALISDAGTPLISDPGYPLVRSAHQAGIKVIPIPGACALITALSASGLPSDRFVFEGFLPSRATTRREKLQSLKNEDRTIIFYESPHRIKDALSDMSLILGETRKAVLARELTKNFETILSSNLGGLNKALELDSNQQKGEFVVLIEGAEHVETSDESKIREILDVLLKELPLKQAVFLTTQITGAKKNKVYAMALAPSSK